MSKMGFKLNVIYKSRKNIYLKAMTSFLFHLICFIIVRGKFVTKFLSHSWYARVFKFRSIYTTR